MNDTIIDPSPLVSVETARRSGHKVRVSHYRYVLPEKTLLKMNSGNFNVRPVLMHEAEARELFLPISSKGGITEVTVTFPDGKSFTALSKCSKDDTYSKRDGVHRCLDKVAVWRLESNAPKLGFVLGLCQ